MKSIRGFNAYVRGVDLIRVTPYGISVTISDLIMNDGKSLELVGVQPDVIVLPAGEDLFKKRDVVISRAAELLGYSLSAETAGKFFLKEEDTSIEEITETENDDG
jgi:C-terminal processing protease CtpA/Prc